jgi:type I restriction enzyme, S subunit
MNIQNYKLPVDWQTIAIQDAYQFTKKPKELRLRDFTEVPFIPMEFLPIGKIYADNWAMKPTKDLGSGTYFEDGDLLVAKITPSFENGKQAIARINVPFGYATTEVIPIQEIEGMSDKFYLHFVLLHPEIRRELAEKMDGSTGRQRLRKEILANKQIPLPPPPEQRRIAHILTTVQTAIEQQARLIALTRELKSALMHRLFSEGLRGEKQKETEIGLVPESWDIRLLESLKTAIDYGTSVKCDYSQQGPPVLRIPNVVGGNIDSSDLKYGQLKRNEIDNLKLKRGDLLFVRTNGVQANAGRCSIFNNELEDCYFASYLIRVRLDATQLIPEFLNEYTKTETGRSFLSGKAIQTADGKFNINSGTIRNVIVPVPKIDEQEEIASHLNFVEMKIALHTNKQLLLEELFRTLLHQLMTAQIRVDEIEFDIVS